ncbi:Uncharacterised protein [Vibrio cholerae]|nr:Uncharacterised protein [Vibrio cholerae]
MIAVLIACRGAQTRIIPTLTLLLSNLADRHFLDSNQELRAMIFGGGKPVIQFSTEWPTRCWRLGIHFIHLRG